MPTHHWPGQNEMLQRVVNVGPTAGLQVLYGVFILHSTPHFVHQFGCWLTTLLIFLIKFISCIYFTVYKVILSHSK